MSGRSRKQKYGVKSSVLGALASGRHLDDFWREARDDIDQILLRLHHRVDVRKQLHQLQQSRFDG